jgi:hypothetical protein
MKLDVGSNLEPFQSLVRDWRAKANEMTAAGDLGPLARVVIEQLLIRADDLEHTIRAATKDPAPRRIFPAASDPAALRVDISPTGISTPPDVAIVAIDDPKSGAERERPVRIVMSPVQAQALVRRLHGVLAEMDIPEEFNT